MIPEDNDIKEPMIGGFSLSQIILVSSFIPMILFFGLMSMGINVPEWGIFLVETGVLAALWLSGGIPGYIFLFTGRHPHVSKLYKKYVGWKAKRRDDHGS